MYKLLDKWVVEMKQAGKRFSATKRENMVNESIKKGLIEDTYHNEGSDKDSNNLKYQGI